MDLQLLFLKLAVQCKDKELCSGKVKEVGKEEGGLYLLMKHFTNKIDSSPGKEVAFTVNNTKAVDMELWHQRLGHVSSAVLARMFAMSQQTLCKVTNCSVCPYAKQTRLVFPVSSI
ncbi:hypothetical protein AABB24_020384, partial [Solanum stoloniferum]